MGCCTSKHNSFIEKQKKKHQSNKRRRRKSSGKYYLSTIIANDDSHKIQIRRKSSNSIDKIVPGGVNLKIKKKKFKYDSNQENGNEKETNGPKLQIINSKTFKSFDESEFNESNMPPKITKRDNFQIKKIINDSTSNSEKEKILDNSTSFKMDYKDFSRFTKKHKNEMRMRKRSINSSEFRIKKNIQIPKSKIHINFGSNSNLSKKFETVDLLSSSNANDFIKSGSIVDLGIKTH